MSKQYVLRFGTDDPGPHFGLAPTFISFMNILAGTSAAPPAIEACVGSTGLYYFTYGPTVAMSFIVDGATTGLSGNDRYITGVLDPIQAVDQQLTAFEAANNSTLAAISASLLVQGGSLLVQGATITSIMGNSSSSYGSTAIDPSSLYGYLKRLVEWNEGDATFNKTSGQWEISSRGASTLLRVKTLTNSSSVVTKI